MKIHNSHYFAVICYNGAWSTVPVLGAFPAPQKRDWVIDLKEIHEEGGLD